jgi:hypothetical protein
MVTGRNAPAPCLGWRRITPPGVFTRPSRPGPEAPDCEGAPPPLEARAGRVAQAPLRASARCRDAERFARDFEAALRSIAARRG